MYFSDNRHRVLTHHMFWVNEVMLPLFGDYLVLENGKKVSIKDICEQHILEDFRMKFIPSVQDYLEEVPMKDWIQNGLGLAPSAKALYPELQKPILTNPCAEIPLDGPDKIERKPAPARKPQNPLLQPPGKPFTPDYNQINPNLDSIVLD